MLSLKLTANFPLNNEKASSPEGAFFSTIRKDDRKIGKQVIPLANMFDGGNKNKDDKDSFYDNLKDLHYKDSWLHNTVELAALGAIMAGAGTMAVRGDFNEAGPGAKRALGIMRKGAEKTLKKSGLTGVKFGWQVFNRIGDNLSKMTPQVDNLNRPLPGTPMYDGIVQQLDKDEKLKDILADRVAERVNAENDRNFNKHKLFGSDLVKTNDNRRREIYEEEKHKELVKRLGYEPDTDTPKKKKGKWFGNKPGDTNPMINPKNIGRDMVTNGLAGLAFGGGISGFHALDRWSANKDNQKNLDDTFSLAGSFLPKDENKNEKKDNWRMKKQAGLSPNAVQRMKDIGSKFPEAIVAGTGYSAVSAGISKATGHPAQVSSGSGAGSLPPSAQNLDNGKDDKNSPHVIIELRQSGQRKNQKKQEATLKVASFNGGLAGLASRKGND